MRFEREKNFEKRQQKDSKSTKKKSAKFSKKTAILGALV
jgi:hypothetical protein